MRCILFVFTPIFLLMTLFGAFSGVFNQNPNGDELEDESWESRDQNSTCTKSTENSFKAPFHNVKMAVEENWQKGGFFCPWQCRRMENRLNIASSRQFATLIAAIFCPFLSQIHSTWLATVLSSCRTLLLSLLLLLLWSKLAKRVSFVCECVCVCVGLMCRSIIVCVLRFALKCLVIANNLILSTISNCSNDCFSEITGTEGKLRDFMGNI